MDLSKKEMYFAIWEEMNEEMRGGIEAERKMMRVRDKG